MGGRTEVLEFLSVKNVDGHQMDLGVTVLAGLGRGHLDDLTGAAFDDDEPVLPQSRALHGIRGRGAGVSRLKGVAVMLFKG